MLVDVTERHIKNGIQKSCEECAISLAVKDAFAKLKKTVKVRTSSRFILISYVKTNTKGYDKWYVLPEVVGHFVCLFDNNKEGLKPFSFELVEKPS